MNDSAPTPDADDIALVLGQHAPRLDDVSRARIAQALAALPTPAAAPEAARRASLLPARRWRAGVAAVIVAAAAACIVWALRSAAHERGGDVATVVPAPAPQRALPVMPAELARHTLRAGLVEVIRFGDAKAELVSTEHGLELVLDSGTVHVARVEDEPLVTRAGALLVTASRASFAAAVEPRGLRLQVVRGEVLVRHSGAIATRTLVGPAEVLLPWPGGAAAPVDGAKTAVSTPARIAPRAGADVGEPASPAAAPSPATAAAAGDAPHVRLPDVSGSVAEAPTTPTADQLEALYSSAEEAMRRGDNDAGRRALEELVRSAPRDRRADSARFDLARIADRAGDLAAAKRWLGEILESGRDDIVREPAHQHLCRVLIREAASSATECLRQLRREHPSSPRDAETLATLARRERAEGGCQAALPLYAEYLRRYPQGAFAKEAADATRACQQLGTP